MVVCCRKYDVNSFSAHHFDSTPPLCIVSMDNKDNMIRVVNQFISNDRYRTLMGPNMIPEGINVSSLGPVILFNYSPDIVEYIHIDWCLRNGNIYNTYLHSSNVCNSGKSAVDPEKYINKQIASFYDLPCNTCAADASYISNSDLSHVPGFNSGSRSSPLQFPPNRTPSSLKRMNVLQYLDS